MALDFPNNPTDGSVYVGDNGVTYTYDGVKWTGQSIETGGSIGISGITVITPDATEISGITTLVLTGSGVSASSAGNAVTLDISGGTSSTGNFIFAAGDASLLPGDTLTLSTYASSGNKESKLTLNPTADSALDVGGGLRVRTFYGTGFEKSWTFNTDGSVTFPDASVQSTAFTGTSDKLTNGLNEVTLDASGAVTYPNTALQRDTGTVSCPGNASTVVYASVPESNRHTIKLLIQVEGFEDANLAFDTQACEMIIAKSFRANALAASVYGVVHTSVAPLATFTANWNSLTGSVEVLCTTPGANSVNVRTFATEITTSD